MSKRLWILRLVMMFAVVSACVDPATFDIPPPTAIIIVDGMINDGPGPYYLRISRGRSLDDDTTKRTFINGAQVTLHEDTGETEPIVEYAPGIYRTAGAIRGRPGHAYHVTIKMPDGNTLESGPETILPAGDIENVRYQFEARLENKSFGQLQADVFNIFIDSHASAEVTGDTHIRWRLTGTYKVVTRPELHTTFLQQSAYMTPRECSGYVVEPAMGGGKLVQKGPCHCCVCFVKHYESKPQLSDTELVDGGQFRNVKIGEVPITRETFSDKYMMEIEQMPISKTAFDFFKIIRTQKESSTNLFQPSPGRLPGNITASRADYPVVGMFWATSVAKRTVFITRDAVPYPVPPMDVIPESCLTTFANSTTRKPASWE